MDDLDHRASRITRFLATRHLPAATDHIVTIIKELDAFLQSHSTTDSARTPETHRRAIESMRKACTLLLRLSRFTPGPARLSPARDVHRDAQRYEVTPAPDPLPSADPLQSLKSEISNLNLPSPLVPVNTSPISPAASHESHPASHSTPLPDAQCPVPATDLLELQFLLTQLAEQLTPEPASTDHPTSKDNTASADTSSSNAPAATLPPSLSPPPTPPAPRTNDNSRNRTPHSHAFSRPDRSTAPRHVATLAGAANIPP